jgi:hypothetical protein
VKSPDGSDEHDLGRVSQVLFESREEQTRYTESQNHKPKCNTA